MKDYELAAELKGLREEIERLRAELAKCKASLAAIYVMADRVSPGTIRDECIAAVPTILDALGGGSEMSDTYNIGPTVPGLFAAHESRFKEAADEIDRLRATLERLREALESIAGGEIYPVQVALDALMAEVEGSK